jgi:hypothetical protein
MVMYDGDRGLVAAPAGMRNVGSSVEVTLAVWGSVKQPYNHIMMNRARAQSEFLLQ